MLKIKIMHVISDLNFGGAGKYLKDICKHIDKDKFLVIAVVPRESVLNNHLESISGISVFNVDGIDNKSFDLRAVAQIRELIKEEKPDIVHSHACLSARVAAYMEKVKRVYYTRHCIEPKKALLKRSLKIILSKALNDKVIAVSSSIYQNLLEEGEKKENISLVYNGVEIPKTIYDAESIKEKYGLNQEKTIITLVGRLEEVKGQMHMIEITKCLIDKTKEFEVLFVGDGSNRDELEERIKREKLPVKMLGHIDEVGEIYAASDIVVNTSNSEALSFAVIEGFSHKKPAVAFDIEGLKEAIEDEKDGYLIEFGDYEAFAECLFKLINSPSLRMELGYNGFEKVKEKFSVDRMVKELENIYMEV